MSQTQSTLICCSGICYSFKCELVMPLIGDELTCPKFQPNIFDSTRCHDCLRQKHLHNCSTEHNTQEKDTSTKEDSDVLSVVSSYCDVSRGGRGFEDSPLCILSPDCDLYLCDRDDDDDQSSGSQGDDSTYSSSAGFEENDGLLHHPSSCCRMTRLDSHRTCTRGWTEVAHGRDGFGQFGFSHGDVKEKRDRESGYFSLGGAAGIGAVRDKGSPPPYRHAERGHPLPSNKSPEPKATIPFRNPDLGVPSERRTSEIQNSELMNDVAHLSPDPVDLSVEVEALAGPRSLSPTPFKQAESLSGVKRRNERNVHPSPHWQLGTVRSSSVSRSSSPGRSTSPFRRGESTSSLNTVGLHSGNFTRGREPTSNTPAWDGRFGGSQKNFRSLTRAVGTVSSVTKSMSYMDLRGSLRNVENNSSHAGSAVNRGSSSPSRQSYDGPGKTKTSPSFEYGHDRQSSTRANRRYDARSQSPKGRTSQIHEGCRSASPVRKGYETANQSDKMSVCYNRESPPASRKAYEAQIQPSLKKAESKSSVHSYRRDGRHFSPSRGHQQNPSESSLTKTGQLSSDRVLKSRSSSPVRWSNDDVSQSLARKSEIIKRSNVSSATGYTPLRNTMSDSTSYVKNPTSQRESNSPLGHGRGSSHSLLSQSRSSSPSRRSGEKKPIGTSHKSAPIAWETSQNVSKRSSVKQSPEFSTLNKRRSPSQNQSLTPPTQRHASSQSSMDSESSHLSAGSSGLNREEYATMADLPKVKTVFQREGRSHLEKIKDQQRRELSLYKPASHSQSKALNSEWDEADEERDGGRLSRAHSSSSLYTQRAVSPATEQIHNHRNPSRSSEQKQKSQRPSVYFSCSVEQTDDESIQQPDLLNFKKGWMSKLDDSGEWRKHWFVLTDAGLKYYRDSAAEENDEVDGEIDLKSCVKVSEYDVEKNYGFQIQTRDAVYTLSAMTAGIRRNWIEVLRKSVQPSGSPDLTQLPDCSADKDNTRHTSSHRHHSQSEASATTNPTHCKFDYVKLSPVAKPATPISANQRESGEGQVKEHCQWQEERSRDATHGHLEAVLSRKGAGHLSEQRRLEVEIEKKWAEFEKLPLKEMRSLPPMGSRPGPLANQALEREVASLRQQLVLQGGREGSQTGWVGCSGVESRCSESLQQMERVHRETLEEMEKHHTQQIGALERERDTLLREETEATARVMKALQKAHRAELEKTTQLAERDGTNTSTLNKHQQAELESLRRELEGLSERYSQKCLELNEAQQQSKETKRQMSQKDRQLEQLKRDNQDLQVRLSEEIKVLGSVFKGQRSDGVSDSSERSWCEMQVLLRVRENELQYLHKELSCLRNQLHFLTTEKNSVCEQYREVCEELSLMKSRSEREIETLREHLRLALNALQEGQHTHNSLQH